jgi:hypothetical protein
VFFAYKGEDIPWAWLWHDRLDTIFLQFLTNGYGLASIFVFIIRLEHIGILIDYTGGRRLAAFC